MGRILISTSTFIAWKRLRLAAIEKNSKAMEPQMNAEHAEKAKQSEWFIPFK